MVTARYVLAVTAAAGMIGAWAPAAVAGTIGNGNSAGVVNIHDNQLPVQACNNNVPVTGVGGQVPAQVVSGALSLLGGPVSSVAEQVNGCRQPSAQSNAQGAVDPVHTAGKALGTATGSDPMSVRGDAGWWHGSASTKGNGNSAGVVNIHDNQLPVQACNNNVPVTGVGGQVPLDTVASALSILGAPAFSSAINTQSCGQPSAQSNNG